MADAMSFEYLLRRIFQVGRYGKRDVDADVYRRLERAESLYILETENIEKRLPRLSTKSIEDLAYEYRVECRRVWSIVENAILQSIKDNKGIFTNEEIEVLKKALVEQRIVTKEYIDKIIDDTEKIYVNHGIYPS